MVGYHRNRRLMIQRLAHKLRYDGRQVSSSGPVALSFELQSREEEHIAGTWVSVVSHGTRTDQAEAPSGATTFRACQMGIKGVPFHDTSSSFDRAQLSKLSRTSRTFGLLSLPFINQVELSYSHCS